MYKVIEVKTYKVLPIENSWSDPIFQSESKSEADTVCNAANIAEHKSSEKIEHLEKQLAETKQELKDVQAKKTDSINVRTEAQAF